MDTVAALNTFLESEFPQTKCTVERLDEGQVTVRHPIGSDELRPGGTVSGPVMMATADVVIYVAILHAFGPLALAVTTNLSINFLNKPSAESDLLAECRLLKKGKFLIVGEVTLYSEGKVQPVAHAVGTYSLPPK